MVLKLIAMLLQFLFKFFTRACPLRQICRLLVARDPGTPTGPAAGPATRQEDLRLAKRRLTLCISTRSLRRAESMQEGRSEGGSWDIAGFALDVIGRNCQKMWWSQPCNGGQNMCAVRTLIHGHFV